MKTMTVINSYIFTHVIQLSGDIVNESTGMSYIPNIKAF